MSVDAPVEGTEVRCTVIGMATDLEVLMTHHDGVVRIEYSRMSASQRRTVHLTEEYAAADPMLALELSRLRPLGAFTRE